MYFVSISDFVDLFVNLSCQWKSLYLVKHCWFCAIPLLSIVFVGIHWVRYQEIFSCTRRSCLSRKTDCGGKKYSDMSRTICIDCIICTINGSHESDVRAAPSWEQKKELLFQFGAGIHCFAFVSVTVFYQSARDLLDRNVSYKFLTCILTYHWNSLKCI